MRSVTIISASVLLTTGSGEDALASYRKGLAIKQALASRDPANGQWQRDLAKSHEFVGEVLITLGRREEGLAAYQESLAVGEKLVGLDPDNVRWQQDLSITHNKIADVLIVTGRRPEAIEHFRKSLAIRQRLVALDPSNTRRQSDLALSFEKIGNLLMLTGEREQALEHHRQSLAIRERLAAIDADNIEWQRNLSISYYNLGDALTAVGSFEEALAYYRKDVAIAEQLMRKDPGNTHWQRDLSVSYDRLGAALSRSRSQGGGAQGPPGEASRSVRRSPPPTPLTSIASATFRSATTMSAVCSGRDARRRRSRPIAGACSFVSGSWPPIPAILSGGAIYPLATSELGTTLAGMGRREEALAAFRQCLAIREALAQLDPGNADWQIDLVIVLFKLAEVGDEARSRLALALQILRQLASERKLPPVQQAWIGLIERALANLPG